MEGVWRVYGGCMEGVWRVFGGCMEGVWRVYGGGMEGVWRVYGGCKEGVWRVYGGGMEGFWWGKGGGPVTSRRPSSVPFWHTTPFLFQMSTSNRFPKRPLSPLISPATTCPTLPA